MKRPRHILRSVPVVEEAKPDPKAQRNFTDPESRIMPDGANKGSFVQGYNAQIAVDAEAQIIVAAEVTQTNDKQAARGDGEGDCRQRGAAGRCDVGRCGLLQRRGDRAGASDGYGVAGAGVRGLRRFALRGVVFARAEWRFMAMTHNLLKLFRHGPRKLAAAT